MDKGVVLVEVEIGKVTGFFRRIGVAAIKLHPGASLRLGDRIVIRGPHTYIEQVVDSLEIDHRPVTEAGGEAEVGLLVHLAPEGTEEGWPRNVPREGNTVHKVVDPGAH